MVRIRLMWRRQRRVLRPGRAAALAAVVGAAMLLASACGPTVPPVESPPPQGLPSGVPPAATRARTRPADAGRLAVPRPLPSHFRDTAASPAARSNGPTSCTTTMEPWAPPSAARSPGWRPRSAPISTRPAPPTATAATSSASASAATALPATGESTGRRLADPTIPIIAFAIDTDGSAATGGQDWGAGTGLRSAGIDHVLLVSSRGAWVIHRRRPPGTTALGAGVVSVDRTTRPCDGFVRGSRAERVVAGAHRNMAGPRRCRSGHCRRLRRSHPSPPTNGALPGQPAAYNVSFRTTSQESPSLNFWMERNQATTLATGDVERVLDERRLGCARCSAGDRPSRW